MLTHAIIDALLGAAGLGDIGQHFPDTDERWKDADTMELLSEVRVPRGPRLDGGQRRRHRDLRAPKLAPHRDAMRALAAGGGVVGSRR